MAAPGPNEPAGWAARLTAWLGLPHGLASRDMAVMCAFNALLHAKPSEPHLVRAALCRDSLTCRWSRRVSRGPESTQTPACVSVCLPKQVPYLLQVKGFTGDAVWNDIFPVFTYSFFACTLLAAPATQARPQGVLARCCSCSHSPRCLQVFGCKPCIVAGALCRLATRFLLLYGHSLTSMRVMQVAYGAGVSAEVVFSAYVFARVVRKSCVTAFSPAIPATHRSACSLTGPGAVPERHQRHRCSRADGAPHRRRGWPARHHSRRVAHQPLLRQPVHRGTYASHMLACTVSLLT